jgi:hypothetical protein
MTSDYQGVAGETALPPRLFENDENFDWPLAGEAEQFLRSQLATFLNQNSFAADLSRRMRDETATDFFEWVDHVGLPARVESALQAVGFQRQAALETPNGEAVYEHPRATLPRVLLQHDDKSLPFTVALRPESVADFVSRNNLLNEPVGEPFSRYRQVVVAEENGTRLLAIERRAYCGFVPATMAPGELSRILKAKELWATRTRQFDDDVQGFRVADRVCERVLGLVERDLACQLFFEAERVYWESRNFAARLQKYRQDQLGLGWGNHDHHTFRCSRIYFKSLLRFLDKLGFLRRERYYAGAEAGWGAQILEQRVARIVVFADVDLMSEERAIDFTTVSLPSVSALGTVGLWVGLHGESFLEAGMHHLEARFDFDGLRDQLKKCGVSMMKPFSDFEFLRQAFTEGERWQVRRVRLERLRSNGLITPSQFDRFAADGAIGSHLENLQRHGGFKGFNQKSVSAIIAATDPRKEHFAHAPAAA